MISCNVLGVEKEFVLRSIRIDKGLEANLQKEAQNRGQSVNSLIASVLEKFDKWDRIAEKFRVITIPQESFKRILESTNDETIVSSASELGEWLPRQIMLFWFKDVSPDSFEKYLTMLSNYEKNMEFEMKTESDKETVITAHHAMGGKWSLWIQNYLSRAMDSNFGVQPTVESSHNSVTFKYTPLTVKAQ
jgi:hypothetical protein